MNILRIILLKMIPKSHYSRRSRTILVDEGENDDDETNLFGVEVANSIESVEELFRAD